MIWLTVLGCGSSVEAPPDPAPERARVVVYSGRSESLVGKVFTQLEQELDIDIEVQYGDTPELVTRMLTEGAESPVDVIFAQDSGHLGALTKAGALATLPDDLASAVDPRFRTSTWIGTSGRLRTMVVDSQVPEADRPKTLADFADPRFKGKIGWAPGNGSFQAHVSALRHAWGDEKTKAWLLAVKANEARVYPKNSPQVAAANTGEIVAGFVNHYYLHRLDAEGRRAINVPFAPEGKEGNVLMVAGAGIRKGSPHVDAAKQVIAGLVDAKRQAYFANETFEYPTRTGVPVHDDVTDLATVPLFEVEQAHLADLGPTLVMLQDVGLQ